jgi:flagellin
VTTSAQIDASGIDAGELSINGVDIRATQVTDDTASSTQNEGSAIAVAAAINDQTENTGVTATVNATEVTGDAVGGGDLDSNNTLTINGTSITDVTVSAGDAGDGLIDAINAAAEDTGVTASRDANGGVELQAQDGRNIDIQTTGNATNITGLAASTTTGTVTLTSEDQFEVAGTDPADAGFAAEVAGVNRDASLETVDVSTQEGANRAIDVVDRALAQVNGSRSQFGALQNRFESSISNLSNISENLSAANSRIQDADFATESANLSRQLILQQANVSVLAQANASNASALTLLGI